MRPSILEEIAPTGTVSLEHDIFPALARQGALLAHRESAYFRDVGSPAALVAANRDLLLAPWPGAAPTPRGESLVLPGATVHPEAHLSGGTVIHPGAVIGPRVHLLSAVVLADAKVEADAQVVRSVIGRRARVGRSAVVSDAALGTAAVVTPYERLVAGTRPPVIRTAH